MNQDEVQLIEKILAGDGGLYAELVCRYQDRVFQLCLSMLSFPQEAEDAAQETFIKAYYALDRFKRDSSFYTWIYRIASNQCLDRLRKRSRRHEESWEKMIEEKGSETEKLFSHDPRAGQDSESREMVHKILNSLPEDYRLILTLREMQELNYEEIARTLKCSLDAVKGRLKRARHEFREKLRHFLKPGNV